MPVEVELGWLGSRSRSTGPWSRSTAYCPLTAMFDLTAPTQPSGLTQSAQLYSSPRLSLSHDKRPAQADINRQFLSVACHFLSV